MDQKILVSLVFVTGFSLGALLMFIGMGFVGPPSFERMRLIATASATIPGIGIALYGLYRRFVEKYTSYHMMDVVRIGAVFFVLLPLVAWLGYPSLHAAIGQRSDGWDWRCSAQGCGWVKENTPANTPTRRPR